MVNRVILRSMVVLALTVLALGLASVAGAAPPQIPASGFAHVVEWGDNLYSIAARYGTSVEVIMRANQLTNVNKIIVGQRLIIPARAPVASAAAWGGCTYYTVRRGDTLYGIAARFGVSAGRIAADNNIYNPSVIYVGMVLRICGGAPAPPPPPVVPIQYYPPARCGTYYGVRYGDNLQSIAYRYGVSVWTLMTSNQLRNPNLIYAGQRLFIPCAAPAPYRPKPRPPAPPPLQPAVCNPSVSIASPRMNENIRGIVSIVGTAAIDNFQFYKVEYGVGEVPFNWISIDPVHREPISNSQLTVWNTDPLPEGVYILKLTAVDNRGQFPTPCEVRVIVNRDP